MDTFRKAIFLLIIYFSLTAATCQQSKPTAQPNSADVLEQHSVEVSLSGTDPDGAELTFSLSTPPRFGSVTIDGATARYMPVGSYIGDDEFFVTASNGSAKSAPAKMSIRVLPNVQLYDGKPAPVFPEVAYPTSPTSLYVAWTESSDNDTPLSSILYEVHASADENFFPTNSTLLATFSGELEGELGNLPAGEKLHVKVIAVDFNANRSLETKAIPVTLPTTDLVIRDDLDIFVEGIDLSLPVYDEETGMLTLNWSGSIAPKIEDVIIVNPDQDARIFLIKDLLQAPGIVTAAAAVNGPVQMLVEPIPVTALMESGEVNVSVQAANEDSAKLRYDPRSGLWGDFPWELTQKLDCADAYRDDTRFSAINLGGSLAHLEGGVEVGCDVTVEIHNIYGMVPRVTMSDPSPQPGDIHGEYSVKSGNMRVSGSVSLKPYINMGYAIPFELPAVTLWQKENPIVRTVRIKLPLPRTPIDLTLPFNIEFTPLVRVKLSASKGQNIDLVTEQSIRGTFDSTVVYEKSWLPYYDIDWQNTVEPVVDMDDGAGIIVKAMQETDLELVNEYSFGVKTNLGVLESLSLTPSFNIAAKLRGEIREREHLDLLTEKLGSEVTSNELRSLQLSLEPSLKLVGSLKVYEYDASDWLPDWVPEDLSKIPAVLKYEFKKLSFFEVGVINTPHLDLTYNEGSNNQFILESSERFGSGRLLDVLADELHWHQLAFENEFSLDPANGGDTPSANGTWTTDARNLVVALEYLPSIAAPLLAANADFTDAMKKYAVLEMLDCSPVIMDRYVIKSLNTDSSGVKDCSVVRDMVTNLEWQRCSAGQTWDNDAKACTGFAWQRYRPQHTLVVDSGVPSFLEDIPAGWRLPTISELRTLVYCSSGSPVHIGMTLNETSCGAGSLTPTIVQEAFPNTPRWGYWSNTPNASSQVPDFWWVARFDLGNVNGGGYQFPYHMRYVRNAISN